MRIWASAQPDKNPMAALEERGKGPLRNLSSQRPEASPISVRLNEGVGG